MNKKNLAISMLYSIGEIGQGLLLHPYQTMQSLQQDKVFLWMTLFPSGVLVVLTFVWRIGVLPVFSVIFPCTIYHFFICQKILFLADWVTLFCLYWQILLLYLFVRFSMVLKRW